MVVPLSNYVQGGNYDSDVGRAKRRIQFTHGEFMKREEEKEFRDEEGLYGL